MRVFNPECSREEIAQAIMDVGRRDATYVGKYARMMDEFADATGASAYTIVLSTDLDEYYQTYRLVTRRAGAESTE